MPIIVLTSFHVRDERRYSVMVRTASGEITAAFRAICVLLAHLADYPILGEDDWSRREYERTIETYAMAVREYCNSREFTPDPTLEDYENIADHIYRDTPCPDFRSYPDDESIAEALEALGFSEVVSP